MHAVVGLLMGLFTELNLCNLFLPDANSQGAFYGSVAGTQFVKQFADGLFEVGWNVVMTSIIYVATKLVVLLSTTEDKLEMG